MSLLLLLPECWDYSCAPPHLAGAVLLTANSKCSLLVYRNAIDILVLTLNPVT
jgi:hypothetical protein